MKKYSTLLISFIFSVVLLSCASNKTSTAASVSNGPLDSITTINKNCSPYSDKYLEFSIITNEVQMSKYEDKNIFKVILDHGDINLDLTEKYKNLGSTEEENEFIIKSVSEIQMLFKYLAGFYFGDLLTQELTIQTNPKNDLVDFLVYFKEYNYTDLDCINYYLIENGLVQEFQTYIKDNPQIQVDTKYKYKTFNNKNYLLGFDSINNFHSFTFALEIDYIEMNDILVPTQFRVTTKQYVDNDGKINLLTSKNIILADNQIVK